MRPGVIKTIVCVEDLLMEMIPLTVALTSVRTRPFVQLYPYAFKTGLVRNSGYDGGRIGKRARKPQNHPTIIHTRSIIDQAVKRPMEFRWKFACSGAFRGGHLRGDRPGRKIVEERQQKMLMTFYIFLAYLEILWYCFTNKIKN